MSEGAYAPIARPSSPKGTYQQDTEAATVHVCKEFKLVYYRGHGSTLERVE